MTDTTNKPADNWSAVGFRAENAKWKKGRGGFGKAGTAGVKVNTTWDQANLWAQSSFLLESVPKALKLSLIHDEDVRI